MFQANDSALINPFQSFDSASLPRVKLPPSVLCGLAPELGWRYVFCLVTDITSLSRLHRQVRLQGCWLCGRRMPALNPSWFLNHPMEKCNKTSPGPQQPTEEEFQFQIRNWFSAHSRASVCSHSVRSKLARNKNGIQIYVPVSGQEKGRGHK